MNKNIISYLKLGSILSFMLFLVNMKAQDMPPQVDLTIECLDAMQGDNLCISIDVNSFEGVTSMQFTINFNPALVHFDSLSYEDLGAFEIFSNPTTGVNGYVSIIYLVSDPENIPTFNVGDSLIKICFTVIGDPGNSTPIYIDGGTIGGIEVDQENEAGQTFSSDEISVNIGCVNIISTDFQCFYKKCDATENATDGSMTFYATGGNPPYTYLIMPGGFSGTLGLNERETISGLAQNLYTVTFEDSDGNLCTQTIRIEEDFPIEFDLVDFGNPTCQDRDDGFIEIETGIGNYTIMWEPTFRNTKKIEDLPPGDYTVTVSKQNGCSASATYTLSLDTLKVTYNVLDTATCEGAKDGTVQLIISGGTPYYDGKYDLRIDGIPQGKHDSPIIIGAIKGGKHLIRVIDSLGCSAYVDSLCVPYREQFISVDLDVHNPLCFGDTSWVVGIVNTDHENKSVKYKFTYEGSDLLGAFGQNSMMFTSFERLDEGNYGINIEHVETGCQLDTSFMIVEPAVLEIEEQMVKQPGCAGYDGIIEVDGKGGTEPYSILWEDNSTLGLRTNLDGGDYSVTITDNHGCTATKSWHFEPGGDLNVIVVPTQAISCSGKMDGSLKAIYTGTADYHWEDDQGMDLGNTAEITNLGAGIYYVTVSIDGCEKDTFGILVDPESFTSMTSTNDPACVGDTNGSLSISLQGGAMPYDYKWYEEGNTSNVLSQSAVLPNIGAGNYHVSVTDLAGCVYETTLTLNNPPPVVAQVLNVNPTKCYNGNTGNALAMASGGSGPQADLYYFWSSGESGVNATMLEGGEQWMYAIVDNCPTDTVFFDVGEPEPLVIDLDASTIQQPDCGDNCNGLIFLQGKGGNPGVYLYEWINLGGNSPLQQNLCPGTYYIELTDQMGCKNTDSITLLKVDPIIAQIDENLTQDINCFSEDGGSIAVFATGGSPDSYQYFWTPNVSNAPVASNLQPGTYQIIVYDDTQCRDTVSYTLTAPIPVEAELSTPEVIQCYGYPTCIGVSSVSGGSGNGYTFTINNGIRYPIDSCVAIYAGDYTINVFDSDGCDYEQNLNIPQPEQIYINAGEDQEIKIGLSSEVMEVEVYSESPIDTLEWMPNEYLECIDADCFKAVSTPPASILYTIQVTDVNGCRASDEILIKVINDRQIDFPNAFSPNGDGYNDQLDINLGPEVVLLKNFSIFDRWGSLVFQRENFEPLGNDPLAWDGTSNGKNLEQGVYVYFISAVFIDGVEVNYSGDITLIR
ncbi:MAG TPA: gliding motility-associated C-terminal domain-containing protein [Saprospiraceae bacterium]|nr:gliding motility-associated C-terminal domain-containing protein [Saprospiraceae bacterium]